MQRIKKRLSGILLFFVAALLLAGCASGPAYIKVDKIPEGMGLVYIYRPTVLGYAVRPDVLANGVAITKLIANGYYPYFSKPGEVEFSAKTETRSAVTLYIEAGHTYYIKGIITMGAFIGRPNLTVVLPEIAEKEIVDCKLIENKNE